MDQTVLMTICGVPNRGANLECPIGLSLFPCRCEKSVLKLRHQVKVSRTEFQARGGTAVLGTPLSEVSALTTLRCLFQGKPKSVLTV